MKIKPLQDHILIEPIEAGEETKNGIIIPDSAKEKPSKGKVKAIGDGKITEKGNRVKPKLNEGDTVLYGKYSGTEVKINGIDYLLMRENGILAICENQSFNK
jgi:chaperonin GroES